MPLVHDPREIADTDAVEPALLGLAGIICMVVGINHITEANVEDFWRRCNAMEKLTGAFRHGIPEDGDKIEQVCVSQDEARSLIGYRCNVTPMTKAKFKGHLWRTYENLVRF